MSSEKMCTRCSKPEEPPTSLYPEDGCCCEWFEPEMSKQLKQAREYLDNVRWTGVSIETVYPLLATIVDWMERIEGA